MRSEYRSYSDLWRHRTPNTWLCQVASETGRQNPHISHPIWRLSAKSLGIVPSKSRKCRDHFGGGRIAAGTEGLVGGANGTRTLCQATKVVGWTTFDWTSLEKEACMGVLRGSDVPC